MTTEEFKTNIQEALQAFAKGNLSKNSLDLFSKLGYATERRAPLDKTTFDEFQDTYISDQKFDKTKARVKEWKYVDLLFQLSREEVSQQASLFDTKQVDKTIIETYLFFALELTGDEYNRTELSNITREINRLFPMPVMLLFKYGNKLTFSLINRRLHKRDESKDVLEKVTLIKDISIESPLRAHIEILFDLSFQELLNKHQFTNFVELHNAWQKTLDTKELNKRFYSELFNWYLWAVQSVRFPNDLNDDKDDNVYNAESVIRLLTRLIFVWFIKEKNLVPETLFNVKKLKTILKDLKPESEKTSVYYRAILQNLFFATLNTPMDKDITDENKDEKRRFINTLPKTSNDHYLDQTKYRYQDYFINPDKALELFATIPFLNGGLFECLDFKEGNKEIRFDGFSSTEKRQAFVPDRLFFADEFILDLNTEYGTKGKKYKVEGLINILDSYKFTIAENTPLEEEIALDPELLGKVFENLLASYNPETQTTARKQTGSFYTPREIVNYMVDESLIAYFQSALSILAQRQEEQSPGSIPAVGNNNDVQWNFFNPHDEIDIHQGNYPHWQQKDVWYFITFRLGDSIPAKVVEEIKLERELWLKKHSDLKNLKNEERIEYYRLFSERVETLLNAGKGSCVLSNPEIARIVSDALLHFNNKRYILDEWVIMPNHVHILLKPFEGNSLPDITHSWKSFTANEINKITGNKGQLWMHESYDHIVRNEKALYAIRNYIRQNPVKAKLKDGEYLLSRCKDACETLTRSRDASGTLETRLRDLFAHTTDLPEFSQTEKTTLIKAISQAKILDPACGSGAFPMGVLHRLVDLLNKLDPENKHWNEIQKNRAIAETAEVFDSGDVSEREIRLNEINKAFDLNMNHPDYARKLFLIENCIYGVDIQSIAIQISKLRFFISLMVDQKVNDSKPNRNILSMPNLETKFVAANTLIGLDKPQQMSLMAGDVEHLEKELASLRHKIFFTRKYSAKKALKKKEKEKREELKQALIDSGFGEATATQIAGWNPFDPMQSAKFFDPETMFGIVPPTSLLEDGKQGGFDVVIGNPPYGHTINENKDYFNNRYISAEGKHEIFKYFIEKGLSLLSKNGMLSYITSDTWTSLGYFKKLRKLIYSDYCIKAISKSLYNVFETATVDTNIYFIEKSKPSSKYFLIDGDLKSREEKNFEMNDEYVFNLKDENRIIKKIERAKKCLDDYCEIWQGLIAYGTKNQPREFTSDRKETKFHRKLLYGGDISKFGIMWSGEYLKYGEWLHRPRPSYIYDNEKILVQRIRNPQLKTRLVCALDESGFINGTGLSNILLKDKLKRPSLKFFLALLNSKLVNYWFSYYFIDVNIKPEQLRKVPVKIDFSETSFETIVDQILAAKAANPKADTSALEKQIDVLVYKLYELTEEEIAIIEGGSNGK